MKIYLLLEAGVLRFEVSALLLSNVKVSTSLAGQGWAGLGWGWGWVTGWWEIKHLLVINEWKVQLRPPQVCFVSNELICIITTHQHNLLLFTTSEPNLSLPRRWS